MKLVWVASAREPKINLHIGSLSGKILAFYDLVVKIIDSDLTIWLQECFDWSFSFIVHLYITLDKRDIKINIFLDLHNIILSTHYLNFVYL